MAASSFCPGPLALFTMDACTFHPDNAAVEPCEVCGRPLCGLCLWYTTDGHRLCEAHARERLADGAQVLPPETYQEAIDHSLRRTPAGDDALLSANGEKIYRGNSIDLNALIAAGLGLVTLASCCGGAYCLPIAGLVLGILAYTNADRSLDARRTRNLAAVGMGVAAFMLLTVLAAIGFYMAGILILVLTGP